MTVKRPCQNERDGNRDQTTMMRLMLKVVRETRDLLLLCVFSRMAGNAITGNWHQKILGASLILRFDLFGSAESR